MYSVAFVLSSEVFIWTSCDDCGPGANIANVLRRSKQSATVHLKTHLFSHITAAIGLIQSYRRPTNAFLWHVNIPRGGNSIVSSLRVVSTCLMPTLWVWSSRFSSWKRTAGKAFTFTFSFLTLTFGDAVSHDSSFCFCVRPQTMTSSI